MPFREPPTRRASRREVIEKRAAMVVLHPVIKALPGWQQKAAMLSTIGARSRLRREQPNPDLGVEAERLVREVQDQRRHIETSLNDTPAIARNGRVTDVLRALDHIADTARSASRDLHAPGGAGHLSEGPEEGF